jgi:hypothetical protein
MYKFIKNKCLGGFTLEEINNDADFVFDDKKTLLIQNWGTFRM